jgi:hypothetical protein
MAQDPQDIEQQHDRHTNQDIDRARLGQRTAPGDAQPGREHDTDGLGFDDRTRLTRSHHGFAGQPPLSGAKSGRLRFPTPRRRPPHSSNRYLGIYMNDQLALGIAWRELARRAAGREAGTPLGDALRSVATGIGEDVDTFRGLMHRTGNTPSRFKQWSALLAERAARAKLNGHVTRVSPLSRFVELDILAMGIDAKRLLWSNLRDLAALDAAMPNVDFDELVARAERQRTAIEPFRSDCGRKVLHS